VLLEESNNPLSGYFTSKPSLEPDNLRNIVRVKDLTIDISIGVYKWFV
jgi:hypothetical protein